MKAADTKPIQPDPHETYLITKNIKRKSINYQQTFETIFLSNQNNIIIHSTAFVLRKFKFKHIFEIWPFSNFFLI